LFVSGSLGLIEESRLCNTHIEYHDVLVRGWGAPADEIGQHPYCERPFASLQSQKRYVQPIKNLPL